MDSFEHWSWFMKELGDKVDEIRRLSDTNYIGENTQALLQILDEVINDLKRS